MKKTLLFTLLIICILSTSAQSRNKYKSPSDSRFVFMTSIGAGGGICDIKIPNRTLPNRLYSIRVDQLLAYQFNPNFFMGVTLGMDFWRTTAFIPIGLNLSVNFTKKRIAPHWYMNVGYSFKWYMNSKPENATRVIQGASTGAFAESGIGLKVGLTEKAAMFILADYKMQHSSVKYSVSEPDQPDNSQYFTNREEKHHYHFVGIKIGILY